MPRGIPNAKVAGQPMNNEDIQAAEKRVEGKRAPLHEEDFKEIEENMAKRNVIKTEDGRKIALVGNRMSAPIFGDSQTLKKFARIEPDWSDWIPCTNDEALIYQDLRVMIGHDGDKKLGLIDERKLAKIKQDAKKGLASDAQELALKKLEEIQ